MSAGAATAARRLALRVLDDSERGGPLLAERLARHDVEALDGRDRAFLHELVLGTLRTRGALDHALAGRTDRPLDRIDAPVRNILRLGAYQLLRTRVPARAAVSESVELARAEAPRACGFVNAVLRRLSREGPPPAPDAARDPLGWMTTAGSLPRWLAERWLQRHGPETACARAAALLEPPPTVVRLNPRVPDAGERLSAMGVRLLPLDVPGAYEVAEGSIVSATADGIVYPQDQGSQLVAHLAAASSGAPATSAAGTRWLDACAAPGGKSTLLADLAPRGWVVACEVSAPRRATLATVVRRWRATNVRVVGADALRPPFGRPFEALLLDAPCSGLGTLGRHPDIRWRARPEDVPRHADRQRALLEAVAPLVAPGGVLVYAACSLEPEENDGVVEPFLAAHPELSPLDPPGWGTPFVDGPFLRTRPERHRGDGFFAAPLRRA